MRQVNLSGIDLNLLPVLAALLRRRNVTHAAQDVAMSQPAMSRALSRLRSLLDDPLLLRIAGGYALSPKAERLLPLLASALDEVGGLFALAPFDPMGVERTIRIASADVQNILLAPILAGRLRREAPGIDLRMEPYGPDLVARMERGSLDFAFALSTTPLPPGAVSEPLFHDELALVIRKGHPAAGQPWTIEDYGRHEHTSVALLGDGQSDLDAVLAAAGVSRRIALITPHFMAALAAVSATDLVTTVSRSLAQRFAAPLGLVLQKPPFPQVDLETVLVWSKLRSRDPVLVWFRRLAREVCATLQNDG